MTELEQAKVFLEGILERIEGLASGKNYTAEQAIIEKFSIANDMQVVANTLFNEAMAEKVSST